MPRNAGRKSPLENTSGVWLSNSAFRGKCSEIGVQCRTVANGNLNIEMRGWANEEAVYCIRGLGAG